MLYEVMVVWPKLSTDSLVSLFAITGLLVSVFTAKRLDLRTMEEETATTEHKKRLKFLLPIWSISGCNGSYLTTIAGIETTEGMCF